MSALPLAQARALIDGALAAARQHGFKPMGVAVVDAAAQVVASSSQALPPLAWATPEPPERMR